MFAADYATGTALDPGFSDPVQDSNRVFRALMNAMADPGARHRIGSGLPRFPNVHPATVALILTLVDSDTPLWLSGELRGPIEDYLRFHCGCTIIPGIDKAVFGVIGDAQQSHRAFEFDPGNDEYPDRSATVIVQTPSFDGGDTRSLKGPGVKGTREITPQLPEAFWQGWAGNCALYPRGIDVILAVGDEIVGLPRSVSVEGRI